MNIDRFPLFVQRSTLLLALITGSLLLAACGGGDGKKSASSSSSLSSQRSSYSAASIPANGSGTWPSVKAEAINPKALTFSWSPVEGVTHYRLLKNDGGGEEVISGDLLTNSATDVIGVHVHDWINTYYVVDACFDEVCGESRETSERIYTATEMLKAIGYLKASNADAADFFGWSIALSADGTTLAVGAPSEDGNGTGANGDPSSNTSNNAGAVYIFTQENNLWVQQAYLKASNTEQPNLNNARFLPNDRFGYRVALSDDGNTLAVSSLLEDSPSWGINCNQDNFEVTTTFQSSKASSSDDPFDNFVQAVDNNVGAVYVFKRENSEWTQDAYIKPEFPTPSLQFGENLALSGDGKTLAVGVINDDIINSGVLHYSSSSARECLEFYPSSVSSSSNISSSSSSQSSATSSYRGGTNSGAVYLYIDTENGWQSDAYLKASNAQASDTFGGSLALSTDGATLAVGAIGEDSNATGVNGDQSVNTCVFAKDGEFAFDVDCKESVTQINNGAVYVFVKKDGLWSQEAYLKPAFTYVFTQFGASVDLSGDGNTLAVGAIGDATVAPGIGNNPVTVDKNYLGAGAAYIFSRAGSTWSQQAYIKPSTVIVGTQFGNVISLSADGNTLAAGSYLESSAAKGIGGDQGDTSANSAGAIYVFTRDVDQWMQANYVKASNTQVQDRFGISVDLSADGKTMAVGAHREAGGGFGAEGEVPNPEDNSKEASGAVYLY